jgi:hypothetical protein
MKPVQLFHKKDIKMPGKGYLHFQEHKRHRKVEISVKRFGDIKLRVPKVFAEPAAVWRS